MSKEILIKDLGISINEDQLMDALEERIFKHVMWQEVVENEFGEEEYTGPSKFADMLKERVQKRVDEAIDNIAGKHVIPNMEELIENFCLQHTNRWGEKIGEPVTFIEYLVQKAQDYMNEPVDFKGRAKKDAGGFSWNENTTRMTYLINDYLQYSINTAMKTVLENGNKTLVDGLEKAIRIQLNQIRDNLNVAVKIK